MSARQWDAALSHLVTLCSDPAAESASIALRPGDFGPDWAHREYADPTLSIAWWSGCRYRWTAGRRELPWTAILSAVKPFG
jgi:hypothetical protein